MVEAGRGKLSVCFDKLSNNTVSGLGLVCYFDIMLGGGGTTYC
jgi:hypothetical protein